MFSRNYLQKYQFSFFTTSLLLFAIPTPVLAKIDSFTLTNFRSGVCRQASFRSNHFDWDTRSRISIASGETITVTLYGHGADFAQDAIGYNIYESITGRGTTTDYNAPIFFGSKLAKGYVRINVRAEPSLGLGNRKIIVKYPTGQESFTLSVVANCDDLRNARYRNLTNASPSPRPPSPPSGGSPRQPDLQPVLISAPSPITRSFNVISTPRGNMNQVSSFFCSNLPVNTPTNVAVPDLTWGVVGVNPELANTRFHVQLIDAQSNRILDTLTLPQGFPANTPLVQRKNYPGRATSLRVVLNPRFQSGETQGCFTESSTAQSLDPNLFLIKVDPDNLIDEGSRENNNELTF